MMKNHIALAAVGLLSAAGVVAGSGCKKDDPPPNNAFNANTAYGQQPGYGQPGYGQPAPGQPGYGQHFLYP